MMVLRHLGPPSTTVASSRGNVMDDEHHPPPIPMDLSNKHHSSSPPRSVEEMVERRNPRVNPFFSIIPPSTIRPLSSPRTPPSAQTIYNNILNNNNNNESSIKCSSSNSPASSHSEGSSPRGKGDVWRLRRKDLSKAMRWRGGELGMSRTMNEDDGASLSHSSPDSGLHRDSPGEDEELMGINNPGNTPPPHSLRKQSSPLSLHQQSLIPLSIIRARYPMGREEMADGLGQQDEDDNGFSPRSGGDSGGGRAPDKVLTKRKRLEDMVTHIKSSKDRSRRNSGDDDTSSGGHGTSGDEVMDEGRELRSGPFHQVVYSSKGNNGNGGCLNLKRKDLGEDELMDDEPCNLVCPEGRLRRGSRNEELQGFDGWKSNGQGLGPKASSMSPTEAAKLLGVDPETYQQQMMQFQLTQAAMLGDPAGILKGMGPYPPLVYLGYYSQILQSFQAQEILKQYAMQSNLHAPNVSQGEKSPSVPRNLGSSRYQCQSPLSPASLSEGPAGVDSDGSTVGQSTPGSANNGKRAPRAMTGRHVRTGTGASPSTLQTLRQKIEERQRIKAQQARNELLNQPNTKNSKNSKFLKKTISKK